MAKKHGVGGFTTKANPTANYLLVSKGRGTSSVKTGSEKGLIAPGMDTKSSAGTKRFDVTTRSLNRGGRSMR